MSRMLLLPTVSAQNGLCEEDSGNSMRGSVVCEGHDAECVVAIARVQALKQG